MTLLILALAGLAFAVWRIQSAISHAPLMPSEADTLDVLDGAAACYSRGGHYYRMDPTRTFYQCADPECGHRVDRFGGEL